MNQIKDKLIKAEIKRREKLKSKESKKKEKEIQREKERRKHSIRIGSQVVVKKQGHPTSSKAIVDDIQQQKYFVHYVESNPTQEWISFDSISLDS